jgi:hypothetical protein
MEDTGRWARKPKFAARGCTDYGLQSASMDGPIAKQIPKSSLKTALPIALLQEHRSRAYLSHDEGWTPTSTQLVVEL